VTKAELIAQVAAEAELTKVDTRRVLDSVMTCLTKALKKESRFALQGLGIFEVVKKAKRKGRNPRTGEPVIIKARKAVKFKAAKALKEGLK
jgi:DNA-binding protein HU-beta